MLYIKPMDLQYQDNIESLYSSLGRIQKPSEILTIDLSETTWVFPHSILSLVTAARLWHRWTGSYVILDNMENKIHGYLERMNLFSECSFCLRAQKSSKQYYERSTSSQRLLEVASIPSNEQSNIVVLRSALRRAKSILAMWITDVELVGSVLTMVSEIGQNIAHSQDVGYIIVQRYKQPYSNDVESASEIHLAIGDIGIGIEESLIQRDTTLKRSLSKGSDFIQHALIQGVSGKSSNRGIGLHRVCELVNRWQGSVTIRSQSSQIRITGNEIEIWDGLVEVPGVQVFIVTRGTIG
ncbi:MAG: hypothetical protein K8L97_08465 [Anaerolineae bacterium]|nr:hypothetical protein [Anaerolineae bacterium]